MHCLIAGATYSCINDEVAEELENLTPLHTPMKMVAANVSVFMKLITVLHWTFTLRISGLRMNFI